MANNHMLPMQLAHNNYHSQVVSLLTFALLFVMQQLGIGSFGGEEGNEEQNAYQAMMQVSRPSPTYHTHRQLMSHITHTDRSCHTSHP